MQIRPKTRIQIYQVLAITMFWMVCGAFLAVYKCVTYDMVSGEFVFIVPQGLPFGAFLLINIIGPAIGGMLGGGILVLFLNDRLRNKSYGYFLLVTVIFFFVFILALNTGVSYFFYHQQEIAASDDKVAAFVRLLFLDPYALRNIATWMVIALLTLFALRIYEKYGPDTIMGLLRGAYHRPHEVERVFMFLDINKSTALAEQLGHIRFFNLLRDFYRDVTDPILNSRGEIYQYVGDEVVVSWIPDKAVSGKAHCLACFFRIERAIQDLAGEYEKKYGVVPTFKAAVHKGPVIVGEMGVIKREIVYSGDILNTTSRMLEQCKVYGQPLIVSGDVIRMIPEAGLEQYTLDPLGTLTLRGKAQSVELFGVRMTTPQSPPSLRQGFGRQAERE